MLVLKANSELKKTYNKLVASTKSRVEWSGTFVVNNDNVILLGTEKSLVFSMEKRKVFGDVVEMNIDDSKAYIVNSAKPGIVSYLTIPLYVLGKWGALKGLVVNHDYKKLTEMFTAIVKSVGIEVDFTDKHLYFYKNGIRFDYEDVLSELIRNIEEMESGNSKETDGHNEYKMGLWRKIKWVSARDNFAKMPKQNRVEVCDIGKNFFSVPFKCPYCSNKLYMVVFEKNKEYIIETDVQRVYLARAYTCPHCHSMFTPKPDKLLSEGDIFKIDFEDDAVAYEDYASLLSDAGSRTTNYNFNRYENQPKKEENKAKSHIEDYADNDYDEDKIIEMMDNSFFDEEDVKKNRDKMLDKAKKKKGILSAIKNKMSRDNDEDYEEGSDNEFTYDSESDNDTYDDKSNKASYDGESDNEKSYEDNQDSNYRSNNNIEGKKNDNKNVNGNRQDTDSYSNNDNNNKNTKKDSNTRIDSDVTDNKTKKNTQQRRVLYRGTVLEEPEELIYKDNDSDELRVRTPRTESEIRQLVGVVKALNYDDTKKILDAISKSPVEYVKRQPYVDAIKKAAKLKAETEIRKKMSGGDKMNAKKITELKNHTAKYREDAPHIVKQIKLAADNVKQNEKAQIDKIMSNFKGRKREDLNKLKKDLKDRGFSNESLEPYIKRIDDSIRKNDEKEIDKLCPDIANMSYDDALYAYDKISNGMYLPELKDNALMMLDKRLSMIKINESDLLVKKLKKMIEQKVIDTSQIHYCNARQIALERDKKTILKRKDYENADDIEDISHRTLSSENLSHSISNDDIDKSEISDIIINNALKNYGFIKNKYEYPIAVFDSSRQSNGKSGFIITPEHIFYKNVINPDKIYIANVAKVEAEKKLFGKGLIVELIDKNKIKLPSGAVSKSMTELAGVLTEFINYLKEKPESRDLKYMARTDHKVKCCYRCGYTFTEGNVCPKCGNVQR